MAFIAMLGLAIAYTLIVPAEPLPHEATAVCGDGTLLPPPDNKCGPEHGYWDHWTVTPTR